jgi:FtsH-binding integral membrane protein
MNALLIYDTSPLNSALKIIITLIFLTVLGIYLYTRRYYSDKIRTFIDIMILFAACAVVAGILRYFGHGTQFGFTEDYSLKWFQSLAYVAEAGCFILAGHKLLHLFKEDGK